MARKRKKSSKSSVKNKKNHLSTHKLDPQALEQQVKALLAAAKFREAVDAGKKLLKLESSPDRQVLLAAAYEGRARGLADKGMFKEAVAIWRNRAELCSVTLYDAFFYRLLIGAGQIAQAFECYADGQSELQKQGSLADVREQLAALSLANPDAFAATNLPAEDVLVGDFPTAKAALEAYCAGDDQAMQQQLKHISFRSPFRDLRQILKALLQASSDASGASVLLKKIAVGSAFYPLAKAVSASLENDKGCLLSNITQMDRESRQFVTSRTGINATTLKLAEELRHLGSSPANSSLIRFIVRNERKLGKAYARAAVLRLLLESPSSRSLINHGFGTLEGFEHALVEAWFQEHIGACSEYVVDAWMEFSRAIAPDDFADPKEYDLLQALVARRILEHQDKLDSPPSSIVHWLEQVLEFDARDHAAYIRLIAILRQTGNLKQARAWLDTALAEFPDDAALLTEAVETAIAGNAYKKAALLAKRILKKDPINIKVRTVLINAHLAHTRKQISQAKFRLAEKELALAETWAYSDLDKGRIALLGANLLTAQGKKAEAGKAWANAETTLGGGICARFYSLIELAHWQAPIDKSVIATQLQPLSEKISTKELMKLLHILQTSFKDRKSQANRVLIFLTPELERIAVDTCSQQELELCCELMAHFDSAALYFHFAQIAYQQWPQAPLFIYHELAAKVAFGKGLNEADKKVLSKLFERIKDNSGEEALIHRVTRLISAYPDLAAKLLYFENDKYNPFSIFDEDDEDEYEDEYEDEDDDFLFDIDFMLDSLMKSIPPAELKKMRRELGEKGLRKFLQQIISAGSDLDLDGLLK